MLPLRFNDHYCENDAFDSSTATLDYIEYQPPPAVYSHIAIPSLFGFFFFFLLLFLLLRPFAFLSVCLRYVGGGALRLRTLKAVSDFFILGWVPKTSWLQQVCYGRDGCSLVWLKYSKRYRLCELLLHILRTSRVKCIPAANWHSVTTFDEVKQKLTKSCWVECLHDSSSHTGTLPQTSV